MGDDIVEGCDVDGDFVVVEYSVVVDVFVVVEDCNLDDAVVVVEHSVVIDLFVVAEGTSVSGDLSVVEDTCNVVVVEDLVVMMNLLLLKTQLL